MIQSVRKALQILDTLHEAAGDMGVSELSRATGLSKSTCHRILATLGNFGYVEQDPATGRFRLGWHVFQLGASLPERVRLTDVARPEMVKLAERTGESINLAIRAGKDALFVDRVSGSSLLRPDLRVGTRLPCHVTGVGKVLLAWLSEDKVRHLYDSDNVASMTPASIRKLDDLLEELRRVRSRGYALDCEESGMGIWCIAVPIRDHTDAVVAGLSMTSLATRMAAADHTATASLLLRHAAGISRSLGHAPRQ